MAQGKQMAAPACDGNGRETLPAPALPGALARQYRFERSEGCTLPSQPLIAAPACIFGCVREV